MRTSRLMIDDVSFMAPSPSQHPFMKIPFMEPPAKESTPCEGQHSVLRMVPPPVNRMTNRQV